MSKLYIFGIGGTGSRVLRSLIMLLASGVECKYDIVPIIIDPDLSNANLTETVTLLQRYCHIRSKLAFGSDNKNGFFRTEIKEELPGYLLPLTDTTDRSFEQFIDLSTMSAENRALAEMLFSQKNLASSMSVGFKGNPNIGSVVLNQIATSSKFLDFANSFAQGDKIFMISSIFGGTGASGFPLLLKTFRTNHTIPNFAAINSAQIGAISVLPYFNVTQSKESEIDSTSFISKTKSALAYYGMNITDIGDLYYIGDEVKGAYNNSDGGVGQRNDAHIVELLSATAVLDFANHEHSGSGCAYRELGIKDIDVEVSFHHLYPGLQQMLQKPLTEMTLLANYLKSHFVYFPALARNPRKLDDRFFSSVFFKELRTFLEEYLKWIGEMQYNNRPLKLFDLMLKDKPFDIVKGRAPGKVMKNINSNYNLFDDRLNRTPVRESDSAEQMFMDKFYQAIERLVKEKQLN